jgi:hypothetical protein
MGLAAKRLLLCSSTAEGDVAWRDTFERGARVDDGTVVAQEPQFTSRGPQSCQSKVVPLGEGLLACSLLCDLLGDS